MSWGQEVRVHQLLLKTVSLDNAIQKFSLAYNVAIMGYEPLYHALQMW